MTATKETALKNLAKAQKSPRVGKRGKSKVNILREEAERQFVQSLLQNLGMIEKSLLKKVKTGDVGAIKEALERALGKVKERADINIRIPKPIDDVQEDDSIQED